MENKEEFSHLEIVSTSDGSKTLFNSVIGENYHSKHGALQESQHVFVNSGLQYYHQQTQKKEIKLLEVGFGTGLNFLLSAEYALQNELSLDYVGIEAYPLNTEMLSATEYRQYLEHSDLFEGFMANYPKAFSEEVVMKNSIKLKINAEKLLDFNSLERFDIIYFDAFAKVHQAEMWNEESIAHTCRFLKDKGIFVTYSVTGDLKRQLKSLGLEIERPQGAAGKREMMRATLQHAIQIHSSPPFLSV